MKNPSAIRKLKVRHFILVFSLLVILVSGQIIIHQQVGLNRFDMSFISHTGRQRVIVQRILKNTVTMISIVEVKNQEQSIDKYLQEVAHDLKKVEVYNKMIIRGEYAQSFLMNDESVRSSFVEVEAALSILLEKVKKIHQLLKEDDPKKPGLDSPEVWPLFEDILKIDSELVNKIDSILDVLEKQVTSKFLNLEYSEWILFAILLFILAIETIFVFRPAVARAQRVLAVLVESESNLQKLNTQLASASQAKSDFVAFLSHELRTPLHAIRGATELISETSLDQRQKDFVRALRNASSSMMSLINNVLDLAKIEAGRFELDEQSFNVTKLIEEVRSVLSISAHEKNTELNMVVASSVPVEVKGDANRLRQVLYNLIGNAIKFTRDGKINVEVHGGEGHRLSFVISDTGIGIAKDKIPHLFNKFTQADATVAGKYGGTGLGLALSKEIIEKMGGTISIESEQGKGTTFRFFVTMTPVQVEAKVVTEKMGPANFKGLRILAVDDTEDNLVLLSLYLGASGIIIDEALSGIEAIEKYKNNSYDLILLDMRMPEMSGNECAQKIRKWEVENQRKPTPIVAISANSLKSEIQESIDAGCSGYLLKPFKKSELLAKIEEYTFQ